MEIRDLRGVLPWNGDGSRWGTRSLEDIDRFVVHHSGTGENADPLLTVRAFNRGHVRRGWPRIGYHYVIDSYGMVYWTNRNRDVCTHAGDWATNARSLGVCLIGDFAGMGAGKGAGKGAACCAPTGAQLEALRALRVEVSRKRGRDLPAVPHYEVVETACPGRAWWEQEASWVNGVDARQKHAGMTFSAGVHLPNDGVISSSWWPEIEGLGLVKALVRLDGGQEVDWGELGRRLRADCTVILRLYWPGFLDAGKLLRVVDKRLPGVIEALGAGGKGAGKGAACCAPTGQRVLIEVGNEPNHASGLEGFGRSAGHARAFGLWYLSVLEGLRMRGYGNLGFPGLAVAEFAHGERTWGRILQDLMDASDWVGCHCYWQHESQLADPTFGENWRWYVDRVPVPVYATEAGNSSCHDPSLPQVDEARQAAEYVEWCRQASAGGVAGVAFFMLGGSEDWKGFRLWPGTVRALAGVGGQEGAGKGAACCAPTG